MRLSRALLPIAVSIALATTGCSREIAGSALGDPNPPPVQVTTDEFGIRAGLADAPVQLELYTEPQCTHCADLQHDFGDQFAYYIGAGQLALTYRPLTFLDDPGRGYSARVVNAMFEAAAPGGAEGTTPVTGRRFQRYVEELWSHQRPGTSGPTDEELAELAADAGIPAQQVQRIERGADAKSEDELLQLEATNFEYLYEIDPLNTGTPTVFDLANGEKLDVYDDDWLTKVMAS